MQQFHSNFASKVAKKSVPAYFNLFHSSPRNSGIEEVSADSFNYDNRDAPLVIHRKSKYRIPFSVSGYMLRHRQKTNFVDLKVIKVQAGKGGNGKVSFLREAGRPKGPPDGGNGGKGGSIYVQAVEGENSLHKLRNVYKAEEGAGGGSAQLSGRNGSNILIQVPVGTVIYWIPPLQDLMKNPQLKSIDVDLQVKTEAIQFYREAFKDGEGWIFKEKDEEYHQEREYFRDLNVKVRYFDLLQRRRELLQDTFPIGGLDVMDYKPRLLLAGGNGGMGNQNFQTPMIRNPRFAKQGRYGIEQTFLFELKLLADLGLVGLPNSGKSTLLRAISNARPEVGHWEFTTLNPSIGTIDLGINKEPFSVADIPGIIAGARDDKGLGLDFLRHVERAKCLGFVISLENDPVGDLKVLLGELAEPGEPLDKKVLIIATKADLPDSEKNFQDLLTTAKELGMEVIPCCAMQGENVTEVMAAMERTIRGV